MILSKTYIRSFGPILSLLLASSFCCILVTMRLIKTGNVSYIFLLWNLFLAWVPVFFAYLLKVQVTKGSQRINLWRYFILLGLWLIFFPNAPYIITDFVHLNDQPYVKEWFDLLLTFSFAFTGLATGIISMHWAHTAVKKKFNGQIGWLFIGVCSVLSGYGIYLGRVLRWNSWDLVTNPLNIWKDIFIQASTPLAQYMTLGFGGLIFCVYLVFTSFTYLNQKSYVNR
ncbi:DUF1361 domain-containing protein [Fulvivirgaceae bacterium BMA10]|uniref:DUF1361 domain-containing protein n=1 Tax=Splendidivirga corallicola TaxID=3051826 RepID=A0ABT8KLJ9_9BACT|nr:DUF1361 domain-containing protein [Fulvivirgaceae bacterium BMA10]